MDQLHQHGAFQNCLPFLVELVLCLDGQDSQEAPAGVSELTAQTFLCWHHLALTHQWFCFSHL